MTNLENRNSKKNVTRMTVDLSSDQRQKLRLLAGFHNVSMGEMLRLMVDDYYRKSSTFPEGEHPFLDFTNQNIGDPHD